MREHFPFTDYDFYAYLAGGLVLVFSFDLAITGGMIMLRDNWSFVETALAIAVAYAAGHLAAGLSSLIIEHWFARHVLHPPAAVLLALVEQRRRERIVGRYVIGRYYEPFSESVRQRIMEKAATALARRVDDIRNPEDVFQVAFPAARAVPDTRTRMDEFRNLYGFARNLALAAVVAAIALAIRAGVTNSAAEWLWASLAMLLAVGMLARFLKFYGAFAAEVLRTFAFTNKPAER